MESDIGFPSDSGAGQVQNVDQIVTPYLQALASFRAEIRNATKGDKSDLSKKVNIRVQI